jgi:hypothetical protein
MLFTWLCDQIIGTNSDEQQKSFGRHFEMEDELVSHITRRSIDLLKANYRASPTFPVYSSAFSLSAYTVARPLVTNSFSIVTTG